VCTSIANSSNGTEEAELRIVQSSRFKVQCSRVGQLKAFLTAEAQRREGNANGRYNVVEYFTEESQSKSFFLCVSAPLRLKNFTPAIPKLSGRITPSRNLVIFENGFGHVDK